MTSYFLVICMCSLAVTSSLDLPDLRAIFGAFYDKNPQTPAKERVKRQDPGIGDESSASHIITSSSLPPSKTSPDGINRRYMPTLGNGYLATTVYGDALFLNGLFNGVGSDSHRAKIPAAIMSRLVIANADIDGRAIRKYSLNAKEGVFTETIDCDFAVIEHRTYIHKYYIRVLVSDISWVKKSGDRARGGGKLLLNYPKFDNAEDITFTKSGTQTSYIHYVGVTKSAEEESSPQSVHVFMLDPVTELYIQNTGYGSYVSIMSTDRLDSNARSEFEECLRILESGADGSRRLLKEHVAAWEKIWDEGYVEMEGDSQLAKLTMFSQYYLFSSLPPTNAKQPPQFSEFMSGLSRSSMAKGSAGKDYQGHVMWDTEMYMLPALVFFQPKLIKESLRYRMGVREGAAANAEAAGTKGYKYPFRSGVTGRELGSNKAYDDRKLYVSGAVAWGIRQYFSATRDQDYLTNIEYRGCDITREIARYFAANTEYDPETARYNIKNVIGPDENYPFHDNNVFTLVLASLAIHWARYAACVCQRNEREEVPDAWVQMAMYYNLPYDNVKRIHLQFEGFEKLPSPRINHTEAIMLTYPLNWNMTRDIMRHDLEYYEELTSDRSPALTWSFYTIGWKWVDEIANMNNFFLKSYQNYVIQPFKIWTEFNEANLQDQEAGSVNFLPGMGGFLQSIIYGFAGIRLRPKSLEFHRPKPPFGITRIRLKGFKYLDTKMDIDIDEWKVEIFVQQTGAYALVLRKNDTTFSTEESLTTGARVTIDKPESGFYIYTNEHNTCEHPRDHIYMPWGYSPFIDGATSIYAANIAPLLSLLLLIHILR